MNNPVVFTKYRPFFCLPTKKHINNAKLVTLDSGTDGGSMFINS